MKWLVVIVLIAVFAASHALNSAYRALPIHELRRRARSGNDKKAAAIYKAGSYTASLELLLWVVGSLSAAFLILITANISWWLAIIIILVFGLFVFIGRQYSVAQGHKWRLAALVAPATAKLLSLLQPIFCRAQKPIISYQQKRSHTGLYEKEDLLSLLKNQSQQADNRFSDAELAVIKNATSFGDKLVGRIMLPRSDLKIVSSGDSIGPLLMDDLHNTGQKRFLVTSQSTKLANPEIIGSLFIKDLLDQLDRSGSVKDIMHSGAAYINETNNLGQALDAFLKTHQHILAVINNFEELVGVITIEQVVSQILGQQLNDEFDQYQNLSAVAGLQSGHIQQHEHKSKVGSEVEEIPT